MSHEKIVVLLVPAAAAVAAALVALRVHFEPPTIPTYSLATDSGAEGFVSDGGFEMHLRPKAPVSGAVGARAFLVRGGEVRPWDPPFSVGPDGSVTIAGSAGVLFAGVPPGEWEIAVAVGRPEVLPTAPRDILRARDDDAGTAGWRLIRGRVRVGR